ncbi:Arm DNA-binding domain-containing protein [Bacillus cereus]|uniref:Arm DNA-binding domain-containing protein n=1 Tax=Bacillus cereus TaxID=1396 RepID=UPI001EE73E77|nr:Arm DNA-binding domain-containing protein [Bacillus cereus]
MVFYFNIWKKEDGKPRQLKKRGFKTKQEAQKAMLDLEQSLTLGTYIYSQIKFSIKSIY